jgi:hypothetical protein
MAKNWIAGAIKHPGALHKELHVPAGEKIPAKKLGGVEGRRANLAKTLEHLHTSGNAHPDSSEHHAGQMGHLRKSGYGG